MVAGKGTIKKKVDATIDLALVDDVIARDWKTLDSLERAVRSKLSKPRVPPPSGKRPSLYWRYRGNGFPLYQADGGRLLPWSKLSPWMKAQIAWLCLQSTSSKVFTITLHEELADELRAKDADPKAYLRDRLVRCLRDEFDCVPWFQFVMEDRSRTGRNVKVHAHGAIQILACEPRRLKNGGYALRARTLIARDGLEAARMKAGEEATFQAMLNASGNGGDRPSLFRGRSQARNVWWRRPIKPFFNKEWVSYFFKNASKVSDVLPDNRLAMCRTLNQEAQRLWALIRNGEAAIEAWPSD